MTDNPTSAIPLTASQLDHAPALLPTPTTNGVLASPAKDEEEEPYTIKCICSFQDDDGNTVLCETCETWQHIECYYPAKHVPDVHNCVDCEPRPVDPQQATERQRRLREQQPGLATDQRAKPLPKRQPPKNPKKKAKDAPANQPPNGYAVHDKQEPAAAAAAAAAAPRASEGKSGSPRDQPPPAKRPKTTHRTSNSISAHGADPKSPALGPNPRNRSSSNPSAAVAAAAAAARQPSPVKAEAVSPKHPDGPYTREFMRLGAEDRGEQELDVNVFNNLQIPVALSSWVRDPEALSNDTQIDSPGKVFERVDCPFNELQVPPIVVKTKRDDTIECFGEHPTWQYLVVDAFVPADGLVGEIKGGIGRKSEYLDDPHNRWSHLRHPEPFVFFHPYLPLYIDTRETGTRCRYVRRSCRPNVTMRTIVSDATDCHFCLRALENLAPGAEIVVGWYYEPVIVDLFERSIKQESLSPSERDEICTWIERVLANFGGCACQSPKDCLLMQVLRRQSNPKTDSASRSTKSRKSRKSRQQTSPLNAAANGSRAGSETVHAKEPDDDQDDSRSTSGSIRSKPHSRDMTPSTQFVTDAPAGTVGPEMSDREKRKLAALEKKFEMMEQDQEHSTQKKKKQRNSGGSNLNTPLPTSSKQLVPPSPFASQPTTPHVPNKATSYADAGTSSRKSDSPSLDLRRTSPSNVPSPTKPSPGTATMKSPKFQRAADRSNYTDSSTQTESGDDPWYHKVAVLPPKKTFVPLSQQLLRRFHAERIRLEESRKRSHDEMECDKDLGESSDRMPNGILEESRAFMSPSPKSHAGPTNAPQRIKRSQSPPFHPIDHNAQKHRPPDLVASPVSEERSDPPQPFDLIKPPPLPAESNRPINGFRPTELRVQLPPAPHFSGSGNTVTTPSNAATPISASASGTMASSPFGSGQAPAPAPAFSPSVVSSVVQQSPVKKKLSLSEYTRSRGSKTETPSAADRSGVSPNPPAGPSGAPQGMLKPSSSLAEEAKAPGSMEGSAVVDSPSKDG